MPKRKTVYNNIVSEEKWQQVNEENKELLIEFLDYKRNTGKSDETIYQYQSQLKIFFVWSLEHAKNKEFIDINKRDIIKFQGYCLNTLKHSPARVRSIRSAISSLSIYIENILDDVYPNFRNIVNLVEAPKLVHVRQKSIITFENVERACEQLLREQKYQLCAYLAVAVYSGLRKQELTRLLYNDFTVDKKIIYGAFYETSPIKIKGDINRKESKLVWNKCDKYLNEWLKYREENNIVCDYLFCRENNDKYSKMLVGTANSFATTLKRYFTVPFYTHSLRHSLATELLRNGIPIEVVKVILSHNSTETTAIYDDRDKNEALSSFENFFNGTDITIEKKGLGEL